MEKHSSKYARAMSVVNVCGLPYVVSPKDFTTKSVFAGFAFAPATLARTSQINGRHNAVLSCSTLTNPQSLAPSDFDPDGRTFGGSRIWVRRQRLEVSGGATFTSVKNLPAWRGKQAYRFVELLTLMVNLNGVETPISETRAVYMKAQESWKIEAKYLPPLRQAPIDQTSELATGLREVGGRQHRVATIVAIEYETAQKSSSSAPMPELTLGEGTSEAAVQPKVKRTALFLLVAPVVKENRGTVADGTLIPIDELAAGTGSFFGTDPKGPFVKCFDRNATKATFGVFGDADEQFVLLGQDGKAQVVNDQPCQIVTIPIENGVLMFAQAAYTPKKHDNRQHRQDQRSRPDKKSSGPSLADQMTSLRQLADSLKVAPGCKTKANQAFKPAETALKAYEKARQAFDASTQALGTVSDDSRQAAEGAAAEAQTALQAAEVALKSAIDTAKAALEVIKASLATTTV